MNRPIRRVGYAVTVLILLLVAQLTYLQVVDADNLANDPKNVRSQLKEYNRARGKILTADGQIVAQSVPTTTRRLQVPAPVPAGGPVRARGRLPVVRQPGGQQRRRGVVRQGAHRSGHELAARQPRQRASTGKSRHQRRGAVAHRVGAADGGGRAATVSAARWSRSTCRPARWWRCTRTPPSIPTASSVHDTAGRADTFNQINRRRQGCAPARVPRPLLPGIDVQGGHQQVGDRGRPRDDRRPRVRRSGRLPDPGHQHHAPQLRRRGIRAAARLRVSLVHSCNATFARARLRARRPIPARDGAVRHRRARRRSTSRPAAEKSVGPLVGADQGPLRPRRHRSGRRVHHAAADGAHRRGHRQQRRDQGTARRAGGPQQRRQDGAHDRAEGLDDVHAADDRGRAHQHDGRRRQRGHRQRRVARRSRASRSPARPAPRRPASRARTRTRGSSRSHPRTRRGTRWR